MNTINCQTKLDYKRDYLHFDVANSAFEDLTPKDATIDFTVNVLPITNGGIIVEFNSLNKLILECDTETGPLIDVLDQKKLEEFSVEFNIGDDKISGLRLDGIFIDLIKKNITLKFNEN